jgi:hypothetical protein
MLRHITAISFVTAAFTTFVPSAHAEPSQQCLDEAAQTRQTNLKNGMPRPEADRIWSKAVSDC